MTPVDILTLISGVVVGFTLGVIGGGGSILALPLLLYVVGMKDPHVAIGTSALAVAANAFANLIQHARAGTVKWPCALVFGASGVIGALIGSTLGKMVAGQHLLVLFAGVMIVVGVSMLRGKSGGGDPGVRITRPIAVRLVAIGLLAGLLSGFFGIGGGFLIVPGLMAATGMTLANAAASSLLSVALFGAATSANYAISGLVVWPVAGLFVLGGAAGGAVGLKLAGLLAQRQLMARRLFASLVLVVAAYVAWKGLTG